MFGSSFGADVHNTLFNKTLSGKTESNSNIGTITRDFLNKHSVANRMINDASLLAYGVPTGIAKVGTGLVNDPVKTVESVGIGAAKGLYQTGKNLAGVTGILGGNIQKQSINYYTAHPLFAALDAFSVLSLGTGSFVKAALVDTAESATSAAIKSAAESGVKSSIIDSALRTTRSVLNPKRFINATRASSPFYRVIEDATRTGKIDKITEVVTNQLIKKGVDPATATKIARATSKDVANSIISQSSKMKVMSSLYHPVDAIFKSAKATGSPVIKTIFGTPDQTAVAKAFGTGVVEANKKTALGLERWLEAVVKQKGLENTVDERLRILRDWKKQSDFANLTPEQSFNDFSNYVQSDIKVENLRDLTGVDYIPVKVISKDAANAMKTDVNSNIKTITEEVANAMPNADAARKTSAVFDRLDKLMSDVHGRDWQKYSEMLRNAYGAEGSVSNLSRAIESLSSRKPTINFSNWSPEAQQIAKGMEGTGYRVSVASAKQEKVIHVSDVLDKNKSKVASTIPDSAIESQRTFLGKVIDNFGLSTHGVVEGMTEFHFAQSFLQNAIEDIGNKFGDIITVKRPIAVKTVNGVVNATRNISIPVTKLYEFLRNNRNEFFKERMGLKSTEMFRPISVYDITKKDLVKFGFPEDIAKAIDKVSRKSLREIPASVIGAGEKVLNLMRGANTDFAIFGRHFDNFLKAGFYMRYQSAVSILFQAQQYLETKLMASLITRDSSFVPGVEMAAKIALKAGKTVKSIPGADLLVDFGSKKLPGMILERLKEIKGAFIKITEEPKLNELTIVRDEILPNTQKALNDVLDSPEFARERIGIENATTKKVETTSQLMAHGKKEGIWIRAMGGWTLGTATKISKAIAQKYGMTLEQAVESTMINGIKIYKNPQIVKDMQDVVQQAIHYKKGFQTSPLIKTMNLVWFPFRFQTKTVAITSKWLGTLSSAQRLMVINNWVNFANWAGTDEGIKWRKMKKNLFYSLLAYTTAWEQLGDTVNAVGRGKLFGGNTGLIGGVPLGFIVNSLQALALVPEDPYQIDPRTGRPYRAKYIPKKLLSDTAMLTVFEQYIFTLMPGMPLYTITGGNVRGVSFRNLAQNGLDSIYADARAAALGEPQSRSKELLQRDYIRIPFNQTR